MQVQVVVTYVCDSYVYMYNCTSLSESTCRMAMVHECAGLMLWFMICYEGRWVMAYGSLPFFT